MITEFGARLALCGSCVALSGCGTLLTRGEGAFFGAYPLEAVVADGAMIVGLVGEDRGAERDLWALYGWLSLPFDVAFDVALLPADVVAWVAGNDKNRHRGADR